ncbi:MAG: SAM-dependent DNA methyltransferase [Chloroflexi bacterium]|nr:SAM-dependent DNA methyltransferase [Chloroflexota bacterium]
MPDKQHTLGQYETPTDVADLLLGFCLRRPSDRLLDPSCGQGAFLARAARLLGWLADGPDAPPDVLWGVELDPDTAARAQAALPQAHILSRSFFTLQPGTNDLPPAFDVIIGNPPYTRAEWIGRLPTADGRQLDLFDDLPPAHTMPEADDKRLLMPRPLWESLGGRSGLHAYFFLHGAQFLREGGRFGFVVPNGWLDVAYGKELKQFLLDHFKILAIIESNVERWFDDAKVNTCLVVLEKCSGTNRRADNQVRLVRLKRPLRSLIPYPAHDPRRLTILEQIIPRLLPNDSRETPETAVRVVTQSDLRPAARWGLALRAPDVYRRRREEVQMVCLQDWAVVQRGFTTGANTFFYLDKATVTKWQLESAFRRPLLKSLRGLETLRLTAVHCRHELLWIPPGADLAGTAAAAYLAWGESQGFHQRTTCAARQPWYNLAVQPTAQIVLPKGVWRRHVAPLLDDGLLVDQQLYQVILPPDAPLAATAALLNSAWFALQCELQGRLNFGAGVLWLAAYELGQIFLPDPRRLAAAQVDELTAAFTALTARPLLPTEDELAQADRMRLDTAVFDSLNFTASERQETLAALQDRLMTRQRLVKT